MAKKPASKAAASKEIRKPYSFKLEQDIIPALQELAQADDRSLNNYVEVILKRHIEANKKKK